MLNAFRHLRSIHGERLRKLRQFCLSAQRLSASQIHSPPVCRWQPGSAFSAQRLSASQIHSHQIDDNFCPNILVLNAFRHLRSIHDQERDSQSHRLQCSTPFGISDPFTSFSQVRIDFMVACSTPFGISDPFTEIELKECAADVIVLNAFRHLRSIHSKSYHLSGPPYSVLNAFRHLRSIHAHGRWADQALLLVLNAFRHLRSIHDRP